MKATYYTLFATHIALVFLMVLCLPAPTFAAIAEDSNTGAQGQNQSFPMTVSLTNTAGTLCTIGFVANQNINPSGITYGGVSATEVVHEEAIGFDGHSSLWRVDSPPTGANDVVVTTGGGGAGIDARVQLRCYTGANTTANGSTDSTTAATSFSFTQTAGSTSSWIIDEQMGEDAGMGTVSATGSNQSVDCQNGLNHFKPFCSHVTPVASGSNTLSYSWTSSFRVQGVSMEITAAAAPVVRSTYNNNAWWYFFGF